MNQYLIYGAGGHARILKDLIHSLDDGLKVACFFNDAPDSLDLNEIPVQPYNADTFKGHTVVLGIGSSKVRKMLSEKVKHKFAVLIHPKAIVAQDVEIGEGTVVLAGAVIQAGARIGRHTIINANVCVEHDAVIGDFVTTYPGVYLGGECNVSEGAVINPNAVIMRFMKVEPYSEIPPGKVII